MKPLPPENSIASFDNTFKEFETTYLKKGIFLCQYPLLSRIVLISDLIIIELEQKKLLK